MHLREWIGKNRPTSIIAAATLVAFGMAMIAIQLVPRRPSTRAWYTTDNGKTWFKADERLVPPFDHGGEPAVLARVYECDGKPFVAWMERYKPDAARRLREFRAAEDSGQQPDENAIINISLEREYKRPADAEWTSALDKASEMMFVNCPDGSAALIVPP